MSKPAIDFRVIQSYLGPDDDMSLIVNLSEYFKQNAPARLESAKKSYFSGDNKQSKHFLHALKNSFLNIGALEAAEQCQEFENKLETIPNEEVNTWISHLESCINTAQTEVTEYLEKMTPKH